MRKIPVKVSPAFFVTAGLIGFLNSYDFVQTIVWIGIILISVLIHEFGHAIASRAFGQHPRIELTPFGGLTIPEGKELSPPKEFVVILMGPLFGFAIFVAASILLQFPYGTPFVRGVLEKFRYVNLFWTFVNLLPILPLDGGQLVRVALNWIFGAKSLKASLYISFFFAALFSVAAFLIGLFLIGGIFLIFAFQSIDGIRRVQHFSSSDDRKENRDELKESEKMIGLGHYDAAMARLQSLREKTKSGMIHTLVSEYMAKIWYDKGNYQEAYALLLPVERYISKEAKVILYLSAYEIGDYKRVIDLSGICFQESQTVDIALRAAESHAMLQDIQSSIEWLKTVKSFGTMNLSEIATGRAFDPIRDSEVFRKFIKGNGEA
jgi:stage IV sporulation protein FB